MPRPTLRISGAFAADGAVSAAASSMSNASTQCSRGRRLSHYKQGRDVFAAPGSGSEGPNDAACEAGKQRDGPIVSHATGLQRPVDPLAEHVKIIVHRLQRSHINCGRLPWLVHWASPIHSVGNCRPPSFDELLRALVRPAELDDHGCEVIIGARLECRPDNGLGSLLRVVPVLGSQVHHFLIAQDGVNPVGAQNQEEILLGQWQHLDVRIGNTELRGLLEAQIAEGPGQSEALVLPPSSSARGARICRCSYPPSSADVEHEAASPFHSFPLLDAVRLVVLRHSYGLPSPTEYRARVAHVRQNKPQRSPQFWITVQECYESSGTALVEFLPFRQS
mmetsp:Transcript_47678/g.103687  ORF Transcript_47678/g.103687 Transcript_47678/m.103687 type:complete len:335 (+) Transcript_47678:103-1107(+)